MAESEKKINKYIDQDLASKIGDLLDRGIHPGHQDFLPALDLKAGMGSHEAIVPRDEYGAFGRWTRQTFGYPKGEQDLAEAQKLAEGLGGHMLLARGAALEKARSEGQGAPPTFETAQQQNPTVFQLSGIQPPQQTQEMLGPPAPGQTEPMPSITGPNMGAALTPPQRAAYMSAIPHAPAAAIEGARLEQARETGRGPVAQLQQHRTVLEDEIKKQPGNPLLQRNLDEVNSAIELATTSQKEGIQPNKVMLSLFPDAKSYSQPGGNNLVTEEDAARLNRLGQITGVPIVAKAGMTRQQAADATLYQRQVGIAGAAAYAGAQGKQAGTIVQPGVRSDLFDRKAFFKTGELKNAPSGITEKQAGQDDYIQLSDAQREKLAHAEQAGVQLDQIYQMSKTLITAKTPLESLQQAGALHLGAMTNQNPTAKVYNDSLAALSNSLSKSLGGERGVLTNVDVLRWVNAMPKFSDTVEVAKKKEKLIKTIYQTSVDAQRRSLAGDDVTAKKTELGNMLERLSNLDAEASGATPGSSNVIDFNDLKKKKR